MIVYKMIAAVVLDLIFGDPYWFPHPVRFIGNYIAAVEKWIRSFSKTPKELKSAGFLLWLIVVATTFLITYGLCKIAYLFGGIIGTVVEVFILYTTLSIKCLRFEAKKIYETIKNGSLEDSRKALSYIVGRDTTNLSFPEIIRAVVETVAENAVDGIIAPMLYGFIGGAPLAMAYKAVNTLDSMVGYKNDKYIDLGCVSAKIDDVWNFVPARLSPIAFFMGALTGGFDFKNSLIISIRDRKNHKSPNCAFPEGAVAGALGVQLGGTNIYFGKEVYKPTIGDFKRELENEDIVKTNRLVLLTSIWSLILFSGVWLYFGGNLC